jgi:hypothetical protein
MNAGLEDIAVADLRFLAVAPDGAVYVADTQTVHRAPAPGGTFTEVLSFATLSAVYTANYTVRAMATNPYNPAQCLVLVGKDVSAFTAGVWRWNGSTFELGVSLGTVRSTSDGSAGYNLTNNCWFVSTGASVGGTRLWKIAADMSSQTVPGNTGFASSSTNCAVPRSGDYVYIMSQLGHNRVDTPAGTPSFVGLTQTTLSTAGGVQVEAVDPTGQYLMGFYSSGGSSSVLKYSTDYGASWSSPTLTPTPANEIAITNCGNSQRWFMMYGGTAYYTPSAGAAFTNKNGNLANYLNTDFDVRMVATLE